MVLCAARLSIGAEAQVQPSGEGRAGSLERELKPRPGLPPFEYGPAPAPLPNYVAGAQWGTQADPIRTMQKPLAPEASMKHLVTFPEFEITLFAAEPEVVKPIWMTWDERGRLWIAETVDYPNELQPEGKGRDRLKICEDTDGNGRADKFTIFAEQLSIPTGFVFANGGVIVVHSGKTEWFKDTNNDDRADERKVLFSGWGTADTHATASNLRYGFDGWIWGVVGYSGFRGTVGGREIRFGQGIFRFKPDGSELEFIRSSNNNTWGLGFSEEGFVFGSTANGNASMYLPIPNRYYEGVRGWSASRLESIADNQQFYPITDKVRQVDWHGKYTAGAGSALYTARSFPKEYWNRVQFVAEPTGHLVGKFHLEARGADFVARNGRNFLASADEWCSPVVAEVGPDGALWISDWYNYIIQHNPTPRGFNNGKGNAYETPLRDKAHGRIYRVAYGQAKRTATLNLRDATPQQWVAALGHENMLWRLHAQRLLVERRQADVAPQLIKLAGNRRVDEVGLNTGATHALWTLKGLGLLEGENADSKARRAVEAALRNPASGVRLTAATVMPRDATGRDALLKGKLLEDADAQVRMAVLLALSEMPASDAAGSLVFAALQQKRNSEDKWLPDAAAAAAGRNDAGFLKAVLSNDKRSKSKEGTGSELEGPPGRVVRLVTGHYAQRGPVESIVPILVSLKGAPTDVGVAILDGLVAGWPQGKAPALSSMELKELTGLMQSLPESGRDRLLALAQRWNRTDVFGASIVQIIDSLKEQIRNEAAPDEKRVAAAKRLLPLDLSGDAVSVVLDQVTLLTPPDLATGWINALTASRHSNAGEVIVSRWAHFTPASRRAAIAAMMRRPEWTRSLLSGVEKKQIQVTDLAAEHWSQLKQNPDRTLGRLADRLSAPLGGVSADREEVVKRLLPLAKEKGDPARGKEVFTMQCATCHLFNGQGGKVGPELSGIALRDRADILMEILDPNRSVEANYRQWNVSTKDGETFSGRLDAETQTTIEILDTTGQKHVIQRKNIASLEPSQLSIMPSGFEAIPGEDLKALLEFLTQQNSGAGIKP